MPTYVYVSLSEEDKISVFELSPDSGGLDLVNSVKVAGSPAPLAIDPGRKFLFAGRREAREISSFQIDQNTGGLILIETVPLEADPCYLSTDRSGKFLLSAYYSAGKVAVHSIGEDGPVGAQPIEWLDTALGAHSIQTDPSNRFAFVPHIAGKVGPNSIFQFRFDESTGHLTPNSPYKVHPDERAGPRHFCFHPGKDILYFSNEQGCSVTAYSLDTSSGTLQAFQTASTLPDDYQGSNTCAQIQISPSGRFLYAPNRGHNSIACFSVDASTGRLIPTERVPTEPIPRAFSLDPGGRFLFVAGLESGRLASYQINSGSGELTPLKTYGVGKGPMWVLIATLVS